MIPNKYICCYLKYCLFAQIYLFIFFFLPGLVSKEKCEVLKRKRCERKRRSVAGQSSLYSDYFQPQPKRTYTPRKPPVPVANINAVIVESPPVDDDEDEKPTKTNSCIICHEEGRRNCNFRNTIKLVITLS